MRARDLPPQLRQTLYCAAQGMDGNETAKAMGLEVSTVRAYRRTVIRKMGARNMAHAIYLGYRRG